MNAQDGAVLPRRPVRIGTSWKMNHTRAQAIAYAEHVRGAGDVVTSAGVELFVLPPYTLVEPVSRIFGGSTVRVGAQNMHWEDLGAFTGEVSAPMLAEAGASIVALGHSERRALFGETDEMVRRKVVAAQRHGLTPIVCVGEPWPVRESGAAIPFVEAQVRSALAGARPGAEIWFAYEPVWAIGEAGRPASPEQAEEVQAAIRRTALGILGEAGALVPVLYGGSVTPGNAAGFLSMPSADGLFVGRAAWTAQGLLEVAQVAAASGQVVSGVGEP